MSTDEQITTESGSTYSGNPLDDDLNWIRWRVGDTNPDEWLQTDAEIDAAIDLAANKFDAAVQVCEAIAAKFARLYSVSLSSPGGVNHSNNYAQKYDHYVALAEKIRGETARTVKPVVGGLTLSDKEANAANTDLIPPPFWRGQFDNRG